MLRARPLARTVRLASHRLDQEVFWPVQRRSPSQRTVRNRHDTGRGRITGTSWVARRELARATPRRRFAVLEDRIHVATHDASVDRRYRSGQMNLDQASFLGLIGSGLSIRRILRPDVDRNIVRLAARPHRRLLRTRSGGAGGTQGGAAEAGVFGRRPDRHVAARRFMAARR